MTAIVGQWDRYHPYTECVSCTEDKVNQLPCDSAIFTLDVQLMLDKYISIVKVSVHARACHRAITIYM